MNRDPAHRSVEVSPLCGGPRLRGDSGAVFVEFAVFAPVLVLLAMGLLEFGLVYKAKGTLVTATRSAARAGANTSGGGGDSTYADLNILLAVQAALGDIDASDIERVVVYNASSSNGVAPASCRNHVVSSNSYGTPGGGANCNVYGGGFVMSLSSDPGLWVSGADNGWEPSGRDVDISDGATSSLGVYIEIDHQAITGTFGDSFAVTDYAVLALEPAID